ncbi:MAG TPA: glycoside hydrolase family 5 protein [Candidatus Angelobacter sp.]|nr:glycoside hydrolase family 5 protein [Candidatus Angelobacter sp.]
MKSFSLLAVIFLSSLCAVLAAENDRFEPANPPQMKRLTNTNSPAYQAAKWFMRGANLGNYLETPKGQRWGVTVSADEFAIMKREGFDHVRVPVRWSDYTGPAPGFELSTQIFAHADFVVTNALAANLAVILNMHHFDAFTSDPDGQTEKFLAIWRQIAAHYAGFTNRLAFELLNEPHDAATPAKINPIFARTIAEIRRTNPHRTIFVGPGQWNQIGELKNLVLPANDDNLIVTVHCYDPFYFTHQGATWAGPDPKQLSGIQFPGPPATPLVLNPSVKLNRWVADWIHRYNTLPTAENPSSPLAFAGKLKYAKEWSDYYGRPVHVGEFGAYTKADPQSRARFYEAFRRACDENHLGWAIWDWSAGFRYWDKAKGQPAPGMREALFGR